MNSTLPAPRATPSASGMQSADISWSLFPRILSRLFLLAVMAFPGSAVVAQAIGSADPGWTATPLPGGIFALALQPDGKLLAASREYEPSGFTIRRFDYAGKLDASFGTGGSVNTKTTGTNFSPLNLQVDPIGRIYVAGGFANVAADNQVTTKGYAIVRYLANGTLDASFGEGGITTVLLKPGDSINHPVVTTTSKGEIPIVITSGGYAFITTIAFQPDGKLLLLSSAHEASAAENVNSMVLVRFDTDGKPDPTFATNGLALIPLAGLNSYMTSIGVAKNGSLAVAGVSEEIAFGFVIKLTAQGIVDPSFGAGGQAPLQPGGIYYPTQLAIQDDNRIVVGGTQNPVINKISGWAIGVFRLNTDGSRDASFGVNGYSFLDITPNIDSASAIAVEPDGKILIAGTINWGPAPTESALIRLKPNGQLDADFGTAGIIMPGGVGSMDMVLGDAAYLLTLDSGYANPIPPTPVSIRKIITNVVDPASLPRINGYNSFQQGSHNTGFAISLRDGNNSQVNALPANRFLSADGYIFPQLIDENAAAHIFVVAVTPFGAYMRNTNREYVRWSGSMQDLVPAYENQPLNAEHGFDLFTGNLSQPGTYQFYIGYRRVDSGELIYSASAKVIEITAP
jgi:uncharacterized delta-60 repeat protein